MRHKPKHKIFGAQKHLGFKFMY